MPRPRRWRRRLAWIGLVLVVLAAALVLLTPWLTNAIVRPRVVAALTAQFNAPVSITAVRYSWFSGLNLEGLRIGNRVPGAGDAIAVSHVAADLRLWALIRGRIVLTREAVIEGVGVDLVLDQHGGSNLQALFATPTTQKPPSSPPSSGKPTLPVIIGALALRDLRLSITDAAGTKVQVPALTLTVQADGTAKPIAVALASIDRTLVLNLGVTLPPSGEIDPSQTQLALDWHLDQAFTHDLLPLLGKAAGLESLTGALSGDGKLDASTAAVTGGGSLTADVVVGLPARDGHPALVLRPGQTTVGFTVAGGLSTPIVATVSMRSPALRAEVAVDGAAAARGGHAKVKLDASADLADACARFPGMVGDPALGALSGTVTASVAGDATLAGGSIAGSATLAIASEGISTSIDGAPATTLINKPRIAGTLRVDTAAGKYALEHGVVSLAGVEIAADTALALKPGATGVTLENLHDGTAAVTARIDLKEAMAAARRLLPAAIPTSWRAEGTVEAEVHAGHGQDGRDQTGAPTSLTARLDANDVHLAGLPGMSDLDLRPAAALRLDAAADPASGAVTFTTATLTSPLASLDLSRTTIEHVLDDPSATLTLAATLEPGRLGALAPSLGKVSGQPVSLRADGKVSAVGGDLRCDIAAPMVILPLKAGECRVGATTLGWSLSGERKWSSVVVQKLTAASDLGAGADHVDLAADRIALDRDAGTCQVTNLVLGVPGIGASVSGLAPMAATANAHALEGLTAHVALDLSRALSLAKRWAVISGFTPGFDAAGSLDVTLAASGPLTALRLDDLSLRGDEVKLMGQGLDAAAKWPLSFTIAAKGRANALDAMDSPLVIEGLKIGAAGVALTVDAALIPHDLIDALKMNGQARAAGQGGQDGMKVACAAKISMGGIQAFRPDLAKRLQFAHPDDTASLSLAISGSAQALRAQCALALPAVVVAPPSDAKSGKAARIPLAPLTFELDTAADAGGVTIERCDLVSDLANAHGTGSVQANAVHDGIGEAKGAFAGGADLARLIAVANGAGIMPKGITIGGETLAWTLSASTQAGGAVVPLNLSLDLKNVSYDDGTLILPKQNVSLVLHGQLADHADTLTLDPDTALTSATVQAKLGGGIKNLRSGALGDKLTLDLTYEPKAVNPLLAAYGADRLTGEAAQHSHLMWSGPLSPGKGQDLFAWLATISTNDSEIGYGTWTRSGFTIVGTPVPLRVADRLLTVDYTCSVNGGPTTLNLSAVLDPLVTKQNAKWTVSTHDLVLNNDLAWLFAYIDPLFKSDGTLTGKAAFQCQGTWIGTYRPADMKRALGTSLAAHGTLSAKDVSISGSPLLVALVGKLCDAKDGNLAEILPSDFTMAKGVIRYPDMHMRVGGITMVFSGTADVVNDVLDMTLTAPFPRTSSTAALAPYLPKTLVIPINGKVSDPKCDVQGAIANALTAAGKEALKNKGAGLVDGLLKNGLKK